MSGCVLLLKRLVPGIEDAPTGLLRVLFGNLLSGSRNCRANRQHRHDREEACHYYPPLHQGTSGSASGLFQGTAISRQSAFSDRTFKSISDSRPTQSTELTPFAHIRLGLTE